MIDERMEEQAALYVLGTLNEAESREFAATLASNAELQELVAKLSAVTTAMAGSVPMVEPPPQLRAKVLAQVAPKQKMVELPEPKPNIVFRLLAAAAGGLFLVCIFLLAYNMRISGIVSSQSDQIQHLNQIVESLQNRTNDLARAVAQLEETNRLTNLRVAMLASLVTNAPSTVAVSLWDGKSQDGVFLAENLKTLPEDEDYELWVIDENQTPVAAGVFHVDATGKVKMDFKPSRLVKTAGMFAVTQEIKGGVPSPTMKNMVLAGK
jgi:anti-sigma-K factor RskA